MKRIGRTWYRIDARGVIIGQMADAREFFVDRPGTSRGLAEWWVRPEERRPEPVPQAPPHYSQEYTFYVEPEGEETEHEALIRKVQALVDRGATEGERAAARAAMDRLRAAR